MTLAGGGGRDDEGEKGTRSMGLSSLGKVGGCKFITE